MRGCCAAGGGSFCPATASVWRPRLNLQQQQILAVGSYSSSTRCCGSAGQTSDVFMQHTLRIHHAAVLALAANRRPRLCCEHSSRQQLLTSVKGSRHITGIQQQHALLPRTLAAGMFLCYLAHRHPPTAPLPHAALLLPACLSVCLSVGLSGRCKQRPAQQLAQPASQPASPLPGRQLAHNARGAVRVGRL